jgi:hypothetical protein
LQSPCKGLFVAVGNQLILPRPTMLDALESTDFPDLADLAHGGKFN